MNGISTLTCLWVHTKPLCDLRNPLRPERALGVYRTSVVNTPVKGNVLTNVRHLAFSTTKIPRKLCNDRHGMRQLRLSATELAKDLADAHRLEATVPVSTHSPHS